MEYRDARHDSRDEEPIPDVEIDDVALAEDVAETDIPDIEEPATALDEDHIHVIVPDAEVDGEIIEPTGLNPDEELDFTDSVGTTNSIISSEEGIPFFPPTDPVVKPDAWDEEQLEVVGGFAPDSTETPFHEERIPHRLEHGDDELTQHVYTALRRDAMTTDLDIKVFVRDGVAFLRGTVHSLDEADAAEGVAGDVPGIDEVKEELNIVPFGQTTEMERDKPGEMRRERNV